MLPNIDPEKLRTALAKFDAELRGSAAWNNWEGKGYHRFAIEASGRR